MKSGGMYDQVGGGFARYSTDERWLVPHFEKMLYDNAQLARVYLEAYQVTRNDEYRRVARETLDYVAREMQAPEGGYFSATDADSEGEEGKFFVWTPDEIAEVLDADLAERFCLYYDITPEGNWEGKSIPNTPRAPAEVARQLGIDQAELLRSVEAARTKVYEARKQRIPPLLDDKVLVAWNGLMIGAMAEGHRVLREPRWLDSAERAARYLLEKLRRPDGGLYRTARAGRAHLDAYLEDYAYLSDALIDLYEAGAPSNFLHEAKRLAERVLEDFGDTEGGAFYFTARGHERLLVRTREGHDGAIPNPNAIAARALFRLSFHVDREAFRQRAARAIEAYGPGIERSPRAFATSLSVLDFMLEAPLELSVVGPAVDPATEALWLSVAQSFLPNRVIGHLDPATPTSPEEHPLPLAQGKAIVGGKAALYLCRNYTCTAPITDPGAVPAALGAGEAESIGARAAMLGGRQLEGCATADGTRIYAGRFATRHGPRGYTLLGRTELSVSRVGFGGYRVDDGNPDHRAALEQALSEGSNLVDTSTNYTDGHSERLIGEVIAGLFAQKRLARSEIVVVSKIGYVQGKNLEIAQAAEGRGKPFPEMVKYGDGLWHCLHPEWLEDQLTRSLGRLGLKTLDVCLLHNPEYFISDAVKRGEGPLTKLRDDFYQRLRRAFEQLEREVSRGRLQHYGVSSNTAISSADSRDATDLGRMLAAAREAGGDGHHFRVLELPMNLLEPGALLEKNNGEARDRSVLEAAHAQGVAVLVNRPLNAFVDDTLVRLTNPPELAEGPPLDLQLQRVAELEAEFRGRFAPMLRTASGGPAPASFFNWAEQLPKVPARAQSYAEWHELEERAILPRIGQLVSALDSAFGGGEGEPWQQWRDRYLPELEKLLLAFRRRAADRSAARATQISRAIDPALPEPFRGRPLSQKALLALLSAPGVTSVLVGMRRRGYVDDALGVMAAPLLEDTEAVFSAARGARI
jgi:aryl-alcohol dehydrogenase-like predicted oxidoreductase